MTDRAKKKEEAKKQIRSLLLSAPVGLTLQELKRDFVEFIGCQLPGRELGYNNAEEFLQDIPDTVVVSWSGHTMMLKGVSNASTKHIQKLVANQKVNSKRKWGVLRNNNGTGLLPIPGKRGGNTSFSRPGMNVSGKWRAASNTAPHSNISHPPRFRQQQRQARHRTLPSVPAYVRSQIYELLENQPDGLPLTHICPIFRRRFGVPLDPVSMGFTCEFDLLSSLQDIVALKLLAGGEYRVMSVEAAKAPPNTRKHTPQQQLKETFPQQSDSGLGTSQELLPLMPQSAVRCRTPTPPSLLEINTHPSEQSQRQGKTTVNTSTNHMAEAELSCNIPLTVQNHIRQIMEQRPKGIFASRLPFEYKNMFKKELPTKTYGYNSVIEFVSDMPHIIRIERPHPQGDWHLHPANFVSSSCTNGDHATGIASSQPKKGIQTQVGQIEKNIQEAIAQVLSISPDGIPLDRFLDTFKAMTGITLDVTKYTTGGLKQFLHSMPDILFISLDASDNAIVRSKLFEGPRRFDKLQDQYKPTMAPGDQTQDQILHLPSDAVSPGCFYKPQPLPQFDGEDKRYITLYVSNIISPGLFWIQLRGRNTTLALEDFMDEMGSVYNSKHLPKDYYMPPSLTKCGMVCAAIFPEDGFWHRAIITGFKDQLYEVYYVDYGNTCYVSIDQLRLLKSKFLKLPAQAIRARLTNIQPVGDGVWKINSRNRMLTLTSDKPLLGQVTNIKDRVISLILTDTSGDTDVHINDELVYSGYAFFAADSDTAENASHSQVPSMELLYGDSQILTEAQEQSRRFVRQAQMAEDNTMNLINLEGHLYLLSSEISRLFFDQDIISAKLVKDNTDVPKVVVCRENYPALFEELVMYEACNVTSSTKMLTLFSLSGMPLILELYGLNGEFEEEMKRTVLEILDWFDPDDPYWKGEEGTPSESEEIQEEADTHSSIGDSSEVPKLEDLQLVHNSLEIKRKRILNKMLTPSYCTPESVNELNEVELHIKRIEALIYKLKGDPSSLVTPGDSVSNLGQSQTAAVSHATGVTSHAKTTQKVAPIVQASSSVAPTSSVKPVTSFGATSMQDMAALLQQQMMMNRIMMEQLQLSHDPASFQAMMRQLPANPNHLQQQQFWPYQPDPATQVTQSRPGPVPPLGANFQPNTAKLPGPPSGLTTDSRLTLNQTSAPGMKGLGRGLSMDFYTQLQQQHQAQQAMPVANQFLPSQLLQSQTGDGQPNPYLQGQGQSMFHGQPFFTGGQFPSSVAPNQQFQGDLMSGFTSAASTGLTQFLGNSNPSNLHPHSQPVSVDPNGIPNWYYGGNNSS